MRYYSPCTGKDDSPRFLSCVLAHFDTDTRRHDYAYPRSDWQSLALRAN